MDYWSRRQVVQVVAGLGLLAGCGRLPGQTQQPAKVPRIGFLSNGSPTQPLLEQAFLEGLRELGYVEGQNIVVEWRYTEGQRERGPALFAELVELPVDLLVLRGAGPAEGVTAAPSGIPIVMPLIADPVGLGAAQSLARPRGNLTGLSIMGPQLSAKRLELLKATVPAATRVGMFWDPGDAAATLEWQETGAAAQALGVQVQPLEIRSAADFAPVTEAAARERPDALLVPTSSGSLLVGEVLARIVEFAARQELPAIYTNAQTVRQGGLMAYGPNRVDLHRRAAAYVNKILKGANPGDLPIEQPREFEFVINLKTAQTLGLTIPPHVLLQATEVIQ